MHQIEKTERKEEQKLENDMVEGAEEKFLVEIAPKDYLSREMDESIEIISHILGIKSQPHTTLDFDQFAGIHTEELLARLEELRDKNFCKVFLYLVSLIYAYLLELFSLVIVI